MPIAQKVKEVAATISAGLRMLMYNLAVAGFGVTHPANRSFWLTWGEEMRWRLKWDSTGREAADASP